MGLHASCVLGQECVFDIFLLTSLRKGDRGVKGERKRERGGEININEERESPAHLLLGD